MKLLLKIIFALMGMSFFYLNAHNGKVLPLSYLNFDGVHANSEGVIFAAEGYQGSKVFYITAEGVTDDFADGLNGPVDITSDKAGNLFVTNFNNAKVSKISPSGEVSDFADVLEGPSGIISDSQDNLYVSHYGTGNGTGNTVLKITPQGVVSVFAQGGALNAPIGTAVDEYDNIYTANFNDGVILKISPNGEQQEMARIESANGYAIGHLAYANGKLFATGVIDNSVYVIKKNGKIKVRKNLGEGLFPNGITFDKKLNHLFVAKAFTSISSLIKIKVKPKNNLKN